MSQLRKYSLEAPAALNEADAEIAKGGFSRFNSNHGQLNEWFVTSDYFKNLSVAEQALSYKALCLSTDSIPWQIGRIDDTSEGKLFPYAVAAEYVSSDEADSVVLSGALGADLVDEAREYAREEVDNRNDVDTVYSLDRLIAIGALSRSKESIRSAGAWFTIEEEGRKRSIGVGGDMHGDFTMVEFIETHGPVAAPTGAQSSISPVEPNFINGYHSVELDIAEIVLRHGTDGMSAEEKFAYYHELIKADKPAVDMVRSHAFGDYDSSLERRFWILDDDVELRNGNTVESLLVTPGGRDIRLDVVSMSEGVVFAQTQRKENGESESIAEIYIPDSSIPDFIHALSVSDMGRVSPREIGLLTRAMLLENDNVSTKSN